MSVLAGPIAACYNQGSVTQQKKDKGYQASNQHCLQLTSSLFPFVFIFQVFICDPSGNSLNTLQPEYFSLSVCLFPLFHKSTASSFMLSMKSFPTILVT